MNQGKANGEGNPDRKDLATEDAVTSALVGIAGFEAQPPQSDYACAFILNQGQDDMIGVYLNHSNSDCKYMVMFGLPADDTVETDSPLDMFAFIIEYLSKQPKGAPL